MIILSILRAKGKKSTLKTGKFIFFEAEKLELFDIVWQVANLMQSYCLEVIRDFKLYQYYQEKAAQSLVNLDAINKITADYSKVIQGNNIKIENKPVNYRSGYYYYISNAYYYENTKQYQQAYNNCLKGLEYFQGKSYNTRTVQKYLVRQMIPYAIILNKQPQTLINQAFEQELKSTLNWSFVACYQAILFIRNKSYQPAVDYIDSILTEEKTVYRIQQIKIIQAWAYLMLPHPYRIEKLMNEVKLFEKEKTKDKAALHILHAFHLLKSKQYDKLINKKDALNSYIGHYLKEKDRIRLMFRIMLLVVSKGFNRDGYKDKLESMLGELKTLPVENLNIEVVRFDVLVNRFL